MYVKLSRTHNDVVVEGIPTHVSDVRPIPKNCTHVDPEPPQTPVDDCPLPKHAINSDEPCAISQLATYFARMRA